MKKLLISTVMAVSLSAVSLTGYTTPTTSGSLGLSQQQLLLVSSAKTLQLSSQGYSQGLQEARDNGTLDTNPEQLKRLRKIANRLVAQANLYLADASQWQWEVHTIESDELNAYVMPGGKITFYTGIIDRLSLTDDEISAIMGHEIAHALREHWRERMSREMATQAGIGLATSLLGLSRTEARLAGMVGDLGLSRPHSRTQESEADQIGVELMARAGYNPQSAITLWQKMQSIDQFEPPQFLSTHPSNNKRITTLKALMPKVIPLYQQSISD